MITSTSHEYGSDIRIYSSDNELLCTLIHNSDGSYSTEHISVPADGILKITNNNVISIDEGPYYDTYNLQAEYGYVFENIPQNCKTIVCHGTIE